LIAGRALDSRVPAFLFVIFLCLCLPQGAFKEEFERPVVFWRQLPLFRDNFFAVRRGCKITRRLRG
jgi:hypothetical protein